MATKDDIISAVQTVADATAEPKILASMGTPGAWTRFSGMEYQKATGQVWENLPSPWDVFVEGLSDWLDSSGASDVGVIKAKLNELIGEFNTLLSDHNSGTVPSSASTVTPLP